MSSAGSGLTGVQAEEVAQVQGLQRSEVGLLWAFVGLASVYLLCLGLRPFTLDFLLKAAPIYCLSGIVLHYWPQTMARWLLLGLLWSSLGDVLLALTWQHAFPAGLAAFLCAQFIYAVVFARLATPAGKGFGALLTQVRGNPLSGLLLLFVALYYLTALTVLLPRVGELAPAVLVYMSAICAMVIAATLLWVSGRQGGGWVLLGALSFLLSDSLIGLNKFLLPFELADLAIMSSYYLAQCLIALGVLAALRPVPATSD